MFNFIFFFKAVLVTILHRKKRSIIQDELYKENPISYKNDDIVWKY